MSLTLEKYQELEKEAGNCIFLKEEKCNSDYNKGCECDGKNPPETCPYNTSKEMPSKSPKRNLK